MRFRSLAALFLTMGLTGGIARADPVTLPCAPNCTPIPPCELDPNKPGCPGTGGPVVQPGPEPAPNPPKKDKVAPVEPPPPEKPKAG